MLGFAVVLAITVASMGIAYLGFERVSAGVASYRNSVAEADLARNIDRELISYRALVRYYVVTGKEEDAQAALTAETSLKDAIDQSMRGTTKPAGLEQITRLAREFRIFTKIFADILRIKRESALMTQNQLARSANMLRYKLDDLPSNADDAELPAIEFGAKKANAQFQAVTALATAFVINADQAVAASAVARLKFVENALHAITSTNEKIIQGLKEATALLDEYRQALTKLIENSTEIGQLTAEMADSAAAIVKGASVMKTDLLSDQQRLESESDATIVETERLIVMLAAGGFLLGALLALLLGKQISRPMIAMCKAMRELANGNFDVVLPGLGRSDELGEMAGAVEEFKMQAIAKAERDAAAQDAQNRASSAARRAELIRFADDFEAAVGSIVSNVSASAVQLEQAAGTLTRTAETTQGLSSQVAGASEQASSNMQSVAAATEELSISVDEIGRRVRESNQIAEAAVLQAQQTDWRIGKLSRAAQEIGDVVKLITAIAEQTNLLALNATDEISLHILGMRLRGLARQRFDLGRDHRETSAGFAGTGGFDGSPSRCQYHQGQSRRHRNRVGVGGRTEFGTHAVERKYAVAPGTRPLHGQYPRGLSPRHSGARASANPESRAASSGFPGSLVSPAPRNTALLTMKLVLQRGLGALQAVALGFRQGLAGAVDIECQHRERGAIGASLATRTAFRGAFERSRDLLRTCQLEHALLQIERVALPGHALRPALWRCLAGGRVPPRRARLTGSRRPRIFASGFACCGLARTHRFPMSSHLQLLAVSAENGDEPDRFLCRMQQLACPQGVD
jgi:HAMP domain-containing protein